MEDLPSLLVDLTSEDDLRAEAAISKLIDCGKPALEALLLLLESSKANERWWATRALAGFQEPEVSHHLVKMLSDMDVEVRQCAALALYDHPDAEAVRALVDGLSSADCILRRLAANSLIAIGESVVLPLLEVVNNAGQAARLEAVRALALIADQRALTSLLAVCKEDSAMMEYWANEGFERMGLGMVYFQP